MKGKTMRMKKIDNRGVAMISIMIAVAFITVIASALLYITYTNFSMKTMDLRSKENFYEIDGQMNKISADTRAVLNGKLSDNPETNIKKLTVNAAMPTEDTPVQYDVRNFYYMADPVYSHLYHNRVGNFTDYATADPAQFAKCESGAVGRADDDQIRTEAEDQDIFTFYTGYDGTSNNGKVTVKKDSSTGATTYTFHNLCIEQDAGGGYVNKVRTDIEITTVKKTGTGEEGGIGDFSMLSDGSLTVAASDFTCIDLYGNSYFSDTDGLKNYTKEGETSPTQFTAPGSNALYLQKEAKINVIGDYLVVYGDINLTDQSCLYLGNGNLTVYGNINISGSAKLICNGTIYMVEGELPGRTGNTDIKLPTGHTKEMHVYPASTSITRLTKAQYEEFCHTLGFDNNTTDDDGITKQIIKPITNFNGSNSFNAIEYSGYINNTPPETSFFGQTTGVRFNTQDTINGECKNRLVFNLKDGATMRELNPNSTFISKNPINIDQKHSVSVTKISDELFDWMIGYDESDSSDPMYDASVHHFKIQTSLYGDDYVSVKDFFDPDCNPTVKKMLRQATGGGGGSDSYYSSIRFVNYTKDYE